MGQVEAITELVIKAEPEEVFDALADYSGTRQKLLPENFSEYEIREGGDGKGTLVHWNLRDGSGRVRDCLLDVDEPATGQLVEKDRNSSMVTTWTLSPVGEQRVRVVVSISWQAGDGVDGGRTFAPNGLGRIYDTLLANLANSVEH